MRNHIIGVGEYTLRFYSTPFKLEAIWKQVESEVDIPFCQTYDWIAQSSRDMWFKRVLNHLRGQHTRYFCFEKKHGSETVICCIGWLLVNGSNAKVFPPSTYSDIQDFVYTQDCGIQDLRMLQKALAMAGIHEITFPFVPEESLTRLAFNSNESAIDLHAIIPPQSIDSWWKGLGSKNRKNLGRKMRLLENSHHSYQFIRLNGLQAYRLLRQTYQLKQKRWYEKGWKPKRNLKTFAQFLLRKALRQSKEDITFPRFARHNSSTSCVYCLKIDGEIACVAGRALSSRKKTMQGAQSYINSKFSDYSPGILLHKYVIEEQLSAGRGFDFMLGSEHYKFELGAQPKQLFKVRWRN